MIIRKFVAGLDVRLFSCGNGELDEYLKKRGSQDIRRGYASVFAVFEDGESDQVIAFYTLSAASIDFSRLSVAQAHGLPRYPQVPAVRLGRLAVSLDFQNKGIGKMLLLDALKRSCASEIAWAFFLVEAKDASKRAFYEQFYFSSFADNCLAMWLRRKQAERLAEML